MQPPTALWCRTLSTDFSGVEHGPVAAVGEPGPGEVRIKVLAAALNFPDLLMTRGLYQHKPALPFVLGMEGCGVVEAQGAGSATDLRGQRICFRVRHGAFATQLLLPVDALSPAPAGLDDCQAAASSVTALTAWVSLVRMAELCAGEWILVHGANGGVGIAAVQLAVHLGARVIATATSAGKLALARSAGAQGVVLQPGWPAEVAALTGAQGVQVCVDPVGGALFEASLRCMGWGGRVLAVGFASGDIPRVALQQILLKGLRVIGVRAGEWSRRNPEAALADQHSLNSLLAKGVLLPPLAASYALRDGVQALQAMAARQLMGKLCLVMP